MLTRKPMNDERKHKKSKSEKRQVIFVALVYFFYLILAILPFSREIATSLSELFYFVISLVVFSFIVKNNRKRLSPLFLLFIPAFFFIYLLQVFSVNNNTFFGSLEFGNAFSHKVAGVPYLISFFWTVTIFSALSLACKITTKSILRILLTSLFVFVLDFFLESVAMKLDYWHWDNKMVPFSNYMVWFFTSLVLSTTAIVIKIEPRSQVSRSFFLIQTIFFIFLCIFL